MSEYTVTYPIHLGQKVWVKDTLVLPCWLAKSKYIAGTIMGLSIWKHGNNSRKTMNILFDNEDERIPARKRVLRITVNAMGKTVFDEEPQT